MAHSTPRSPLSDPVCDLCVCRDQQKKIRHASKRSDGIDNLVHDVVGGSPHVSPQQERQLEKKPGWNIILEDKIS